MSDEAAFLRAIQANPNDATAKLVYADWLDEHGQPERAEYVRRLVAEKRTYPPLYLHGAWLDLFQNRVPLWDPVTLLALGRLDGWLAAFAKCSQHASDIVYDFRANLFPRRGSMQSMADEWFGSHLQPVRLEQLGDWQADLRRILHTDLLVELGKVTGGPAIPGAPNAGNNRLVLQVEDGRNWIIDSVEETILAVIRPTAGWQAHITLGPKGWYALQWTDVVLEAVDRVLFLHFSFSD
jgi:uncharacterized protein (TIGR02996 family)